MLHFQSLKDIFRDLLQDHLFLQIAERMKSNYDYIKIFQAIIQYATKENIIAPKTINKLLFLLKEK